MWVLGIALALLICALVLWGISAWQRRRLALPSGRVIHIDTGHLRKPEGTLFSPNYSLVGRPDYLINQGGRIIPIEVKSGLAPLTPYPSHLFQLAAYAILVREHFGRVPPYGILKYRDRAVEIPFTQNLLDEVAAITEEMRRDLSAAVVDRSHSEANRCRACGYRDSCDQRLA
ncbi:MAG: Dna2/Cas4 domain-containing protein [Anaerolineales bacterium]|nr:Dna2/Cas4 domain-containing protein [Anaerolineales bacterium]